MERVLVMMDGMIKRETREDECMKERKYERQKWERWRE